MVTGNHSSSNVFSQFLSGSIVPNLTARAFVWMVM